MRALRGRLEGRRVARVVKRRPDIRFPLPEDLERRLVGRRVEGFGRRAKYIVWRLEPDLAMLLHLGMSGRLLFDGEPRGIHEHVTLDFDDGSVLRFVDPRRFGMLDLCEGGTAGLEATAGCATSGWSRWGRTSTARPCCARSPGGGWRSRWR
jgi:formamidopyrimidine-DNA glycosylase